jgi:hypothetical protein
LSVKLQDCLISSWQTSGGGSAALSLNFTKIVYTTTTIE